MRLIRNIVMIACAAAALSSAESLLLLPVSGDTSQAGDMTAVNQLYRDAVENQFKGRMLPMSGSTEPCADRNCALQAARNSNADEVIYSTFSSLGSKWIFSSTLLKTGDGEAFNQRLTALSIEDMEAVTRRMADALLSRKNIEQSASLDNITQRETTTEPERRHSIYSTGLALGYLFPLGSSYSYQYPGVSYNPFTATFTDSAITHQNTNIIRLSWMNNWQFRNDLLLNTDVVWAFPFAEIGADLNVDYLMGRGDFTPFLGGGLGLHYVHPDENTNANDNKRNSGPTLNVQGGLMLFRTYDVNVVLRGQYQVVLNSDHDNGFGVDVGLTYRKKDEVRRRESSGEGAGFFTYVGYIVVGLLAISIIGALAN